MKDTRRTLAASLLAVFTVVLDNTEVNVALPTLERALAVDGTTVRWIVELYVLAFRPDPGNPGVGARHRARRGRRWSRARPDPADRGAPGGRPRPAAPPSPRELTTGATA